jgi:DNA-directed RNA polymerase specialized sigma24 family protein
MDRATVLGQLPETYAEALRLRDAGLSDDSIAGRLDVPTEAMTLLLRLAEAKVANLMVAHEPASPERDITAPRRRGGGCPGSCRS